MQRLSYLALVVIAGCPIQGLGTYLMRTDRPVSVSLSSNGEVTFEPEPGAESNLGRESVEVTADAGILLNVNATALLGSNDTEEMDLIRPPDGAAFFQNEGHAYLRWLAFHQRKQKKLKQQVSKKRRRRSQPDGEAEMRSDTFTAVDGTELYMPRLPEVARDDWDAFKEHVKTTPDAAMMLRNFSGDPDIMRSLFLSEEDAQRVNGDAVWFSKIWKSVTSHPIVKAVVNHPIAKPIVKAAKWAAGGVKKAARSLGMLSGVTKAFEAIQKLLDCFEQVKDEKFHVDTMLKFLADRKGHSLGELMRDFTKIYVTPATDTMTQTISDATDISKYADMFRDANGDFTREKAVQLLDMGYDEFEDFAHHPAWEPFGCVEDHVIEPGWEMVKPLFTDLLVEVGGKFQKMWDEQVMGVVNFVSQRMVGVIDFTKALAGTSLLERGQNAWSVDSVVNYVLDVVNTFCQEKSKDLNKLLLGYTEMMMNSMGNFSKNDHGYENIHTMLGMSALKSAKVMGVKVLMNWMKDLILKVADKIISPALGAARDLILTVLANAKSALTGLCGLIPEAGAAVCALLTSALTGAENAVSTALVDVAKNAIIGVLNSLMNKAKDVIEWVYEKVEGIIAPAADKAMSAVSKMADALAPVLNAIKPIAEGFIPMLKEQLGECDESFDAISNLLKVAQSAKEVSTAAQESQVAARDANENANEEAQQTQQAQEAGTTASTPDGSAPTMEHVPPSHPEDPNDCNDGTHDPCIIAD